MEVKGSKISLKLLEFGMNQLPIHLSFGGILIDIINRMVMLLMTVSFILFLGLHNYSLYDQKYEFI